VNLPHRLIAVHDALDRATLPHAFGGAIALAYCTLDPRGTRDLDVNVFVPTGRAEEVLAALPEGVEHTDEDRRRLESDGQVRVWWDDTPLDLFLDYAPIHAQAAAHARQVSFEGALIRVLGPVELAVFKAMFDRTKDWADIEAILAAGAADREQIAAALAPMLGDDDARWRRLDEAVERAARD
jgi:hypothetical protein